MKQFIGWSGNEKCRLLLASNADAYDHQIEIESWIVRKKEANANLKRANHPTPNTTLFATPKASHKICPATPAAVHQSPFTDSNRLLYPSEPPLIFYHSLLLPSQQITT